MKGVVEEGSYTIIYTLMKEKILEQLCLFPSLCVFKIFVAIYVLRRKEYYSESCSVMSDSLRPHGLYGPWNSQGQNTGVGSLCLLQGIFPTQGWNPGLPHCRQILYQLSHLIVCHGYKKWKMAAQMPSVFHPCSVKMVLLGTSLVIQ